MKYCQVEQIEINDQHQQLSDEFERNYNSLVQAMQKGPSKNASALKTLQEAEENGLSKKTPENVLQALCFDDLRVIGDYTLENTSDVVFSGKIDGEFRKLNFSSSFDRFSQPNITVRRTFPQDSTIKKFRQEELTKFRLLPWFVVAYVKLKRWDDNLDRHVYQALYYCRQTLSCSPERSFFITALYNFQSIVFCAARFFEGRMRYLRTKVLRGVSASRELAKFLSLSPSTLGFKGEYPSYECIPIRPLGRGSTSVCLEVQYHEINYVAKISRNRNALQVERIILQYLKNKNDTLAIPTVVDEHSCPQLYSEFTSSSSSSDQLPYVSFLTEVYEHRYPSKINVKKCLMEVWNILTEVHKLGICHRDVRYPNIGFKTIKNTLKVYLLDWSSSRPFVNHIPELNGINDGYYLQGSTSTASNKVITEMLSNPNNYSCYPSDEVISIIYVAYKIRLGNKNLSGPFQVDEAIETWEILKLEMSTSVQNALSELENMDTHDAPVEHQAKYVYNGFGTENFDETRVNQYLSKISNHVMDALNELFPNLESEKKG